MSKPYIYTLFALNAASSCCQNLKTQLTYRSSNGEKVTVPAHGKTISIQGVTVATVNDKVQLQKVETWFDPLDMFRQIAPNGIVNKEVVGSEDMVELKADAQGVKFSDLQIVPGDAVASSKGSDDTKRAYEEMGALRATDCPFLNQE